MYHHDDATHPGDVTSVTDARGKIWTYTFDAYGLSASLTEPGTAANKTTWVRNNVGWVTSTTSPRGNAPGAPAGSFTTTFANFTTFGAWRTVTDAANHISTRTFDADWNIATVIDAATKTTTYTYDNENRATRADRPGGSALQTSFWPGGQVKDQTDAAGNVTSYDYDALGNLATRQDPGGNCGAVPVVRCTTSSFDAIGNVLTKQEPSGLTAPLTTSFGYDAAGQLLTVGYSDGTTPNITSATYDGAGRRLSLVAANGTSNWTWDSLGRMITSADPSGAVGYKFDAAGNLTTVSYPGGTNNVTRAFDDAGRLASVTDWLSNTTSFATDPDGNITSQANANGTTTATTVDPLGAIASISAAPTAAPASPFATFAYVRNALEQVTKETTTGTPDLKTLFGYDRLDRMTGADTDSFTFDAAGRLTRLGASTQTIDNLGRVTSQTNPAASAKNFGYDARGNRTSAGSDTFGFDQANRLTSATVGPDYARTVTANRPLGYWRLGEGTGSYAADSAGLFHDGLWQGTPTRHVIPGGLATGDDGAATFASGSKVYVGRRGEMYPVQPTMIDATTTGLGQYNSPWTAGLTRPVQVTGLAGVPTTGVDSVVVSITALPTPTATSWHGRTSRPGRRPARR